MLYLHGGWPRTGTLSLQTALSEHREQLAAERLVFPERWKGEGTPAHHGLYQLLAAGLEPGDPLADLKGFLTAHADRNVLLSAEGIAIWLFSRRGQSAVLSFISAAREAMPVKCVWTLRRFDETLRSAYLFKLARGADLDDPSLYFENMCSRAVSVFPGMGTVEEAVAGEVTYVKYDRSGVHQSSLVDAFDLPDSLSAKIGDHLRTSSRRNVSLSHKAATTLANVDALAEKVGADFDRHALQRAFLQGELVFEEDWRCELVDTEVKRRTHEKAVAAARRAGVTLYVDFYGDDEIAASGPAGLDIEVLTDEDLERLVSHHGVAAVDAGGGQKR